MPLTSEEVRHIALLARIGMTDEEVEQMQDQLSNILEHFDVLSQVNTEGVEPTGHSVDVTSVMREDKARDVFYKLVESADVVLEGFRPTTGHCLRKSISACKVSRLTSPLIWRSMRMATSS